MPGMWLTGGQPGATTRADAAGARRWGAVLVGLADRDSPDSAVADSLDEPARLAATDEIEVAGRVVQARQRPDPATYLGSGTVREPAELTEVRRADPVIADGELTPAALPAGTTHAPVLCYGTGLPEDHWHGLRREGRGAGTVPGRRNTRPPAREPFRTAGRLDG